MGPFPFEGEEDSDMINAGKQTITTLPGAVLFDSCNIFCNDKRTTCTTYGIGSYGSVGKWRYC